MEKLTKGKGEREEKTQPMRFQGKRRTTLNYDSALWMPQDTRHAGR